MNSKVLEILYPERFEMKNVYQHIENESDLIKLLDKSGVRDNYIRLLRQRLKYLDQRMDQCVLKSDWFESLKKENGYFSIKFKKNALNLRIIFTFINEKNGTKVVLLHSFSEKKGSDYKSAIAIAKSRYLQIKE